MADSEWSEGRRGEIPETAAEDRKVPELDDQEIGELDHQDQEEPDPGASPWQFWSQVVIEKGLPLLIQLLLIWNLVHGNGG